MATYYWMGQTGAPSHFGGTTCNPEGGYGIRDLGSNGYYSFVNDGTTYGTSNVSNYCWNTPGNWLVKVAGRSGGQGSTGGGGITADPGFYFKRTNDVPGGDDIARFVYFKNSDSPFVIDGSTATAAEDTENGPYRIPQAPCLLGGYVNESRSIGWANAGNTSGRCQVIIEESWGTQPCFYSRSDIDGEDRTAMPPTYKGNLVGFELDQGYPTKELFEHLEEIRFGAGATFAGGLTLGFTGPAKDGAITGLRLNATTVREHSRGKFNTKFTLVNSDINSLVYKPVRDATDIPSGSANSPIDWQYFREKENTQILDIRGGTVDQIFVNIAPGQGRFVVSAAPFSSEWNGDVLQRQFNIDSMAVITSLSGPTAEDGNGDWYGDLYSWGVGNAGLNIQTSGTIPYVYYTAPWRPKGTVIGAARIENLIVTPEKPRRYNDYSTNYKWQGQYTPFTIGRSGTGGSNPALSPDGITVDKLEMRSDGVHESESWNVLAEAETNQNLPSLRGINNTVAVNFPSSDPGSVTIKDFQFEGGRFILGEWEKLGNYPGSDNRNAEFEDSHTIKIEKGFLNEFAAFDGRCWDTPEWAGLKIGFGTTHPSDSSKTGFEINSSDAEIILPVDMRMVAAYVNQDQSGVTVDPELTGRSLSKPKFGSRG